MRSVLSCIVKFLMIFAFLFFGVAGVEFAKQHPQQLLSKIQNQQSVNKVTKTINLEKKYFTVTFVREAKADESTSTATATDTGAEPVSDEPPSWLAPTILWLQGVPTVGPILVEVLKWLGIVATLLTLLSAFLMGLSKAVSGIAAAAGFVSFAAKAQAFFDKILKYAKWFSMFNVQKK